MTPDQVSKEIRQIVEENRGRMSLKELASHLDLGIEVIEPAVIDLCGLGEGRLVNGLFVTPRFVEILV